MRNPDENRDLTAELMEALHAGRLDPPEPTTYPLAEAAKALADLEGRRVTGKVVLVP
jgi:NADPH2:quinone reductase